MTTSFRYPKASRIFQEKLKKLPTEYGYLIVFHLSKNNASYLKEWIKTVPVIGVISIPYSEQPEVKKEISKIAKVYSPSLDRISDLIVDVCKENSTMKIILVEIGGYSSVVADKLSNVILAVEDSSNGHRRFLENEKKLSFPLVSIAFTKGKKIENEVVGLVLAQSVIKTFAHVFPNDSIDGKNVLIMGYGDVGQSTARVLKKEIKNIIIYDPKLEFSEKIKSNELLVLNRLEAINLADIIVGCSGYPSIQMEDIPLLRDEAILLSGSSRQVEFPYENLLPYKDMAFKNCLLEKFKFNEKTLYIAYKGQPINFYFDFGLGNMFDIPMTLLVQSIIYGLSNDLKKKVYTLSESEERSIFDYEGI